MDATLCTRVSLSTKVLEQLYKDVKYHNGELQGVLVEGGCDVLVDTCRVDFGTQDGIRVDVNYDSHVRVRRCVFVGKQGRGVVDMFKNIAPRMKATLRAMMGSSSRPVETAESKSYARPRNAPSVKQMCEQDEQNCILPRLEIGQTDAIEALIPGRAGATYRQLGFQHAQHYLRSECFKEHRTSR